MGGFGSPFFGTSAAVASAASVGALVLSAKPAITAAEMRTALTTAAVDIMSAGFDRDSGNGIVMALEAINSLGVTGFPNLELASVSAKENPGNGNEVIEAGEGALLQIQLKNTGGVKAATDIIATLTSSTPGVIITQPAVSPYADLAAGTGPESNLFPFTFTLASNFPCGQLVNFTLTTSFSGNQTRALDFSVQTGMLTITNTLGSTPTVPSPVTFATGLQVNRINRNGVISSCGTPKAFPGAITGSHSFDAYSFQACQSVCLRPALNAGAAGINLFESLYTPGYVSTTIGTNYAGDAGLSTNLQSFGVETTASNNYTLVVNDVAGNPLPAPAPPNTYTIEIPTCVFSCNVNQLPVAIAHDVTVTAATTGGSANANINNGSFDPEGGALTLTQFPAGPYPQGTTVVILTATDPLGASSQTEAAVTVTEPPDFSVSGPSAAVSVTAGQTAMFPITVTAGTGGFAGTVTFTQSGAPTTGTTVSFSPASGSPGSTTLTSTLKITTTPAKLGLAGPGAPPRRVPPGQLPIALWAIAAAVVLASFFKMREKASRRSAVYVALATVFLLAGLGFAGCGSSGSSTNTNTNATPAGTSTIKVTVTSGTLSHSTQVVLTVR